MKNPSTFLLYTLTILLLSACGDKAKENHIETIKNPVNTYLDSRVHAMGMAEKSLKESNKRNAEQEEQLKALYK